MTWGRGTGAPWGGAPLVPTDDPLASVAGPPTTWVFIDEPDGPLPGIWEAYSYAQDGAGGIVGSAEPAPATYYRVVGGLGLWAYERTPAAGAPFVERGIAAQPPNVLPGPDGRLSVLFRSPLDLFDAGADEFVLEVTAALRTKDAGASYVGGRVSARWAAGAWATPVAYDAVRAVGGTPAVLASGDLPDIPRLTDLWAAGQQHEVVVDVRGEEMRVDFDGHGPIVVAVPSDAAPGVAVVVRAFNRTGAVISPAPCLIGVQATALRSPIPTPLPQSPGDASVYEHPQIHPIRVLPADLLLNPAYFKRVGARQFEAVQDIDSALFRGGGASFKAGDVVRATERVARREFIPIVPDLHRMSGLANRT